MEIDLIQYVIVYLYIQECGSLMLKGFSYSLLSVGRFELVRDTVPPSKIIGTFVVLLGTLQIRISEMLKRDVSGILKHRTTKCQRVMAVLL